jgi:hypothetical protein
VYNFVVPEKHECGHGNNLEVGNQVGGVIHIGHIHLHVRVLARQVFKKGLNLLARCTPLGGKLYTNNIVGVLGQHVLEFGHVINYPNHLFYTIYNILRMWVSIRGQGFENRKLFPE